MNILKVINFDAIYNRIRDDSLQNSISYYKTIKKDHF